VWGYVESDFRRDYGIRLTESLPHMSWREFRVLLDGLSPYGAVAAHYKDAMKAQREEEAKNGDGPPPDAIAFWNRMASFTPNTN